MTTETKNKIGWVLTTLVGLILLGSATAKFVAPPGMVEQLKVLEFPASKLPIVGTIEIVITLLYLIPRTSFLGAILVCAYLGGAVWTHVRVGDVWIAPVIIGVVAWTGLGLRRPEIFLLAFGLRAPSTVESK
jgi:hypothetical protein